jgi:hypothetical protein
VHRQSACGRHLVVLVRSASNLKRPSSVRPMST